MNTPELIQQLRSLNTEIAKKISESARKADECTQTKAIERHSKIRVQLDLAEFKLNDAIDALNEANFVATGEYI